MGLFRKRRESFGLDIGSSAVKVVQLDGAGRSFELRAYAMVPLPHNAIAEGIIKDPPAVVAAIKEAVGKAGIKTKTAAISVSGRELIVKKVQLPRATSREIADAIQLEAEHHIPFAIDEVFLDYQVVGETSNSMDLILVAVKKSKVTEYFAVAEEAGVSPVIVDLDGFAMENQYELNAADTGGDAVALIDIGASVMKTNVIRGGASIFARDIPFGGHNYTQAIAQRLNIPFEKAEVAKVGRAAGVNWDDMVPALEAVSRELSLEVQRTFDYFASTACRAWTNFCRRAGASPSSSCGRSRTSNSTPRRAPSSRARGPSWRSRSASPCGARGTRPLHDQDQPCSRPRAEGLPDLAAELQPRRPLCPPLRPLGHPHRRMVVDARQ